MREYFSIGVAAVVWFGIMYGGFVIVGSDDPGFWGYAFIVGTLIVASVVASVVQVGIKRALDD